MFGIFKVAFLLIFNQCQKFRDLIPICYKALAVVVLVSLDSIVSSHSTCFPSAFTSTIFQFKKCVDVGFLNC